VLPDRFESGTPNLPGIAGLGEGVRFVLRRGTAAIFRHETALCQQLYRSLERTEGVTLYTAYPQPRTHAPVLSFNIEGMDSEQVAEILSRQYGIAVRAGLHCAPLAHETYGTEESGTVRVVPSVFTQPRQIQLFSEIVKKISKLDRKKVANLWENVLK
jgi:selenocysteine lyase/cysteine desulfurase